MLIGLTTKMTNVVLAYSIFQRSNLISWSCEQQQTVVRSKTESEYKSLFNTAAKLHWYFMICSFPWWQVQNYGVIILVLPICPLIQSFMSELNILKCTHYIRNQVLAKKLQDSFLSTTNQLADLLTKPLSSVRFHLLRANLHVQDLPIRLRGRIGDKTESDSNDTVAAKGTRVSSQNRKDCNWYFVTIVIMFLIFE